MVNSIRRRPNEITVKGRGGADDIAKGREASHWDC